MIAREFRRGDLVILGLLALGNGSLLVSCNRRPTTNEVGRSAAAAPTVPAASKSPFAKANKAKFSVLVRGPVRSQEPIPVETDAALPVQTSGAMVLEAQLDEPAFIYLIWIDCHGQVLPLYPWNNETLEVTDIDQPPPVRRATNRVFSPMLGRTWPFTEGQGLETAVLLARSSALPDIKLGQLLKDLPQPAVWQPHELSMLALDTSTGKIESFLPAKHAAEITSPEPDDTLTSWMRQLGQHFELVQVVRFAHGKPDAKP